MGHRASRWSLCVALMLAAAACEKNQPGDGVNATADTARLEVERSPASVADHTFKSYFAWRYYAPDGTFENSDIYGGMTTGRWWMEDGEVCAKFDGAGEKPLCSKPDFSKLTPGRNPVRL